MDAGAARPCAVGERGADQPCAEAEGVAHADQGFVGVPASTDMRGRRAQPGLDYPAMPEVPLSASMRNYANEV